MVKGGEDRTDSVHTRHDVNPSNTDLRRVATSVTGDGHDAASGLHGQVKRYFVSSRSVLSVTSDAANDDVRWHIAHDALKGSRLEILDDNVNLSDERADPLLLLFDVDRLDAFATVAGKEVRSDILAIKSGLKGRSP